MRIRDKVVVITGGASGLGRATAQYLLEEKGARVAILDLNAEAGDKAVTDLGSERAMFVQTDVSDEESVQKAINAVIARFGAIHVCINGAAIPTGFKLLNKEGKAAPLAKFAQITSVKAAGPGHQLVRGMRTAPLPANVLASCSARFFVAIPEIERRLALSSKGNCRTIDPSSDWTIKHWPQELFGAAVPPVTPAHLKLNRGTRR